jgi:hypothetical protein
MSISPVILLEFNELTPSLIERFIGEGRLPNFKRFREESLNFTTHDESEALEPWIQWVTVHSGLPYEEHGVFRLDEGHKLAAPRLWDIVSDKGLTSWVCGSMNVRYADDSHAVVLPDPWCTKVPPRPADLEPYFRFVQTQVQEHTNDAASLSAADYARFATWMATHGLSGTTIRRIFKQLIDERSQDVRWKRVSLLDWIQFDVFRHYYSRLRPAFSTFFLNSTAHYQHSYWDLLEPAHFRNVKPNPKREKFQHAIQYGYENMDALIGELFRLAGDDATLVLCTALSQQPSEKERKRYRPVDFDRFLAFVGVRVKAVVPVMADQFHLSFDSPSEMDEAERLLRAVTLDGAPTVRCRREDGRLFCSCKVRTGALTEGSVVKAGDRTAPFSQLFYEIPTGKIADHHPDGVFWIRQPSRVSKNFEERVPLTGVAPSILSLLGIAPPPGMRGPVLVA